MIPDENTSGRREARRALAESRTAGARADRLIEELTSWREQVAERRQQNHFTQKLRAIMSGESERRDD